MANPEPPPGIDVSRPHSARIYDFLLGGKDNFAADRAVAEQVLAKWPGMRVAAQQNRAFVGRAVRYLAVEAGIDQFLDLGAGLPTGRNVHEVAQVVNPAARVVYVDSDPIVLAHARALLTSSPQGSCAYIDADVREPEKILAHPAVRETLDLDRPVAVVLAAVLHFIPDSDEPRRIIETVMGALPAGSYLVASHGTAQYSPGLAKNDSYSKSGITAADRDAGQFAGLAFAGLDLVPPGVVLTSQWHPDCDGPHPDPAMVATNAGVARKP